MTKKEGNKKGGGFWDFVSDPITALRKKQLAWLENEKKKRPLTSNEEEMRQYIKRHLKNPKLGFWD